MSDISQFTSPDGTVYDIKDTLARITATEQEIRDLFNDTTLLAQLTFSVIDDQVIASWVNEDQTTGRLNISQALAGKASTTQLAELASVVSQNTARINSVVANMITSISVNGTTIATSGNANITSIPASIVTGALPNGVTATTQEQSDNSTKIATTEYVTTAIAELPEPMVFKGSLGVGGTITTLPTASEDNSGFTYKVITDGTYQGKTAKVGDTFISDGAEWILIPSGDEPSGTVTSVKFEATSPIAIDNDSAITESGVRVLSHTTSGVSNGAYGDTTAQTPGYGETFKVPSFTVDTYGHLTTAGEHTVTMPSASKIASEAEIRAMFDGN